MPAIEILRIENISIGQFDDTNFYVAEIRKAGEGAKDAGQDRLEGMRYYPLLHTCLWKAAGRVASTQNQKNLKAWAEAIEQSVLALIRKCEEAGKKLEKARKK